MKPIQIFKAGTHTAMNGQALSFSESDLTASAAAYDPALHEAPLVVGHPKDNAPAYGWVAGLTAQGEALTATPSQVNADFAELVKGGSFKKVSASFYPPDHSANPAPGVYYLRHVGFLGATAPAVKGLKAIEFGDGEDGIVTVEFGEGDGAATRELGWALASLGRLAQAVRSFLVEEKGEEAANKAIGTYQIEDLFQTSGRLIERGRKEDKASPSFSEGTGKETTVTDKTKDELAAEAKKLEEDKAALDKDRADFAEREKKTDRDNIKRDLDGLVAAGKLAPGVAEQALEFACGLAKDDTLEFGEGDAKKKLSPRDWFMELLTKSGSVIDFSERSAPENGAVTTADFAAPDGAVVDAARLELHNKALAYQQANPNTSYEQACAAVGVR